MGIIDKSINKVKPLFPMPELTGARPGTVNVLPVTLHFMNTNLQGLRGNFGGDCKIGEKYSDKVMMVIENG